MPYEGKLKIMNISIWGEGEDRGDLIIVFKEWRVVEHVHDSLLNKEREWLGWDKQWYLTDSLAYEIASLVYTMSNNGHYKRLDSSKWRDRMTQS